MAVADGDYSNSGADGPVRGQVVLQLAAGTVLTLTNTSGFGVSLDTGVTNASLQIDRIANPALT